MIQVWLYKYKKVVDWYNYEWNTWLIGSTVKYMLFLNASTLHICWLTKVETRQNVLKISCNPSGEAAGLALGLVMVGSKSAQAIEDMVGYAQETQHEKILRGLAVGIAMVMYGRMEEADTLIESLCRDKVKLKSHQKACHG